MVKKVIDRVADILQIIGGIILSVGYIPQIIQIVKTRSVLDLNLFTFLSILLGVGSMEFYAIRLVLSKKSGHAFLFSNSLSLLISIIMVVLILTFK